MSKSIKLKDNTYWDISSIHLDQKNYANNISSLINGINFNGNDQQLITNKTKLVVLNLTFITDRAITLNQNTVIFKIPDIVTPKANVILYARTYLPTGTTHGVGYIRAWSNEVVVNFSKQLASNEEICLMGCYYAK